MMPYIQSISESVPTGLACLNSAHSWTSIRNQTDGKEINFVSESGALEFIVFASAADGWTNRAKKVQQDLALATGFVQMAPIEALGFNFCMWVPESTDAVFERKRNFNDFGYPLDMVWLDVENAD